MIELKNIVRAFHVGDQVVHALDEMNLSIQSGEYVSIMGSSGSGKSTLLNVLGLLDTPTGGEYFLNGQNVSSLTDNDLAKMRQREIGFVFQSYHLIPRMNALENVEMPMILAQIGKAERQQRAIEMLTAMGLHDRINHRPDQLSGGQRQRVAIARAIAMQPSVLLADEPTGNLDSASSNEVINIIEQLHTDGLTLVLVTHDPTMGKRANRRITLKDGAIAADQKDTHAVY